MRCGAFVSTSALLVCTLLASGTAYTTSHTGQVGSLRAEIGGIVGVICNASWLNTNRAQGQTNRPDWRSILGDSIKHVLPCLGMWDVLNEQRVCERCTPPICIQALCSPLVKIIRVFFRWVLRSVSTNSENTVTQCNDVHDWVKWLKHGVLQIASELARVSIRPGYPQLPLNTLSSAVCHVSPGRNILTTCQHLVDSACGQLQLQRVVFGALHGFFMESQYYTYDQADVGRQYPGSTAPVSLFSNSSSDDLAFSLGCWEPELRTTISLFSQPGRWDVSMRCIDVLQVIAKQITDKVIRIWLSILIHTHLHVYMELGPMGKYLHAFITLLPRLFDSLSDILYQKALYHVFKRLKKAAELRRQQHTSTSPVTVSCRGLKGRSSDVRSTLVRLYRITIINEWSVSPPAFRAAYSAINTYLPCLLESIV